MLCNQISFVATFFTVGIEAYLAYVDIIPFLESNFGVTLFGCNKKEMVFISKSLSLNGYRSNLATYGNLAEFSPTNRYLFIANLDCKGSFKFLQKANTNKLFSQPFHWAVFYGKEEFEYQIKDKLSNLSILVDSDFNLVGRRANGEVIYRKIFKKHIKDSSFNVEDFRINDDFKKLITETSVLRRRKNLDITLKASVVLTHNESLNHLTDKRDKHIDSITKVNYVLVLLLASIYNITLNFSFTNTWGYQNNSHWTGMMGELIAEKADIGATSLFMLKERIGHIDYVAMISPTKLKFVFRQPKLSYVTNVYTLPFDNKVWISTMFLIIVMMLVLFIAMKWESTKKRRMHLKIKNSQIELLNDSFVDVAFVTIGAICQQSTATLPYSAPGRIVTLFLFISLMFLYVSYSANIVALLQTSSTSIKTLEDLLKSRISVGVDDTVYNHYYFATADEPIRKALYQEKVAPPGKPPNFMYIEEGVKRMRRGLFAFHMETGAGYKLVGETFKENEKCGLEEIAFLQVVDPWMAIQKNSPYKEMLKIGLRLLQENGMQQRENNLIYTRKPTCASKSSTFVSVGMIDCYPAAAILAGGISAAMAIFILELYIHYRLR